MSQYKYIVAVLMLINGVSCHNQEKNVHISTYQLQLNKQGQTIQERFQPPDGFVRLKVDSGSWQAYLRNYKLKEPGSPVLLYNGSKKHNQSVHAAVLDISVGDRNLQQCADAVMRLRADYLFMYEKKNEIAFNFVSDGKPRFYTDYVNGDTTLKKYHAYLNYIFSYANTRSLYAQLKPVVDIQDVKIGDVFIQKGNPYGHAIIVVDVVVQEETGAKKFLLAQSYMPAQSIHILKNPVNNSSPWYDAHKGILPTPEWEFLSGDLRRFD